ncbi:MAG TPA: glycosyltransferase [Terriglobales bacterium]|nr:glycosyltransferase [Terriglobales bacterium]
MPKISALIHTNNDGLRLGRSLDSLRACDEIIVIDHGSSDNTEKIAKEHGAEFKTGIAGVDKGTYAVDASNDWILCLGANESLSEGLEAALFEWKNAEHEKAVGFNVRVREENGSGWKEIGPETRLVNRKKLNWTGDLPPTTTVNDLIHGDILRFHNP